MKTVNAIVKKGGKSGQKVMGMVKKTHATKSPTKPTRRMYA